MPYKNPQVRRQKQKEYNRKYRKVHPEKHRASVASWSKTNLEKNRAKNNRYYARLGLAKRILFSARSRAKKKGIEFSIELSDVVIPLLCPVFGEPLVKDNSGTKNDYSPTLDRIDNTKGYTKGNVWVISWRANRIKSDASIEELEKIVAAVKQQNC